MTQTADVLVVGAGIMGCCTAFELARRGVKVTVLERGAVGSGATGRSSSIVRTHYSHELTARMALYSLRAFQNFDDVIGGDCGFQRTGWVAIMGEGDREGLANNIAMHQRLGINARLIDANEVRELVPFVDVRDVAAASYEHESGYADPHLTAQGYANAAKRHGATVLVDHAVTGILLSEGPVRQVVTDRGTFEAPVIINCTGPWTQKLAERSGLDLPIVSSRIQVAFFKRPAAFGGHHPVIMDFLQGVYFRSEIGDLTLAGRIDPEEADEVVDPDDYGEYVDDEFVAYVGERFLRRCPDLGDSEHTTGFSSLYAVTPDWHPIIDELPRGGGHFVCSGFSGHGFKLGPAVGVMMADLVLGEAAAEFSTELFRYDRFERGALVRGNYEYSIVG